MEQPSRKSGTAQVAAERANEASSPVSPETVLEVDVYGGDGARHYVGKFRFKVPTMGQRVDIAALKARYTQELQNLDRQGDNIADAIAYLNITLDAKSAPAWWTDSKGGIDLYDFQPLLSLYAKARAYEATFLGGRAKPAGDDGAPEGGADDAAGGDVGDGVQSPAERPQVLATFGKGGG